MPAPRTPTHGGPPTVYDALRDLLPRVRRKLILTPEEPIDLSILGAPPG